MTAKKKIKSCVSDPRWRDLVIRYRYDWITASSVLFGDDEAPTWQQESILEAIQETGARVTVTSGHGTGKSAQTAKIIIMFAIFFPRSRSVLVANKIQQVMTGVFKYLKDSWKRCCDRHPWLRQYFVLTDTTFYEVSAKGVWTVIAKGYRRGNEEALAGEHAKHLLYIIDEASGIEDKAFGVMTGALTQTDNRMLLLSQPTRPAGYFYDSHHRLARTEANPLGRWIAITLNSEESPLVTPQFIQDKLLEYGGRNSVEYMVKVLGRFPSSVNGFTLSREQCEQAQRRKVLLAKGWGWLACCDVGNGRDSSVLSIFRVSGYRNKRRLYPHKIIEVDSSMGAVKFADLVSAECDPEKYPNISLVVDGDGIGAATADSLEQKYGRDVQRIRWGRPMHSKKDKSRFINQRAFANVMAADAVKTGRLRIDKNAKTVDQASKIPCFLNESGQWVMMKKEIMRTKHSIKSPDRWDTYCFAMLADYTDASMDVVNEGHQEQRAKAIEYLNS
jgi:hypothetical protein